MVAYSDTDNVAVIQMTSTAEIQSNLKIIEQQLNQIVGSNIRLVVLPENFAFFGYKEKDKLDVAEDYGDGLIQSSLKQMAKKYGLWIVAGSIPIKSEIDGRCFAASIVFDDSGEISARYDKMHLFDVQVSDTESYCESDTLCPGSEVVTVETPVGRIGLSICYDLRFPELYRKMQLAGADIFIVPAAFTYNTGKIHWQTLLAARAIENLSYVLASNQAGTHMNGRRTYGHSMILSPWGENLACSDGEQTTIIMAQIDLQAMQKMRHRFPCLKHQKLNING